LSKFMEEFLGSLSKKTSSNWKRGINLFVEFYGKSVDVILEERKDDLTPRNGENLIDQKNRADRFERELEKFHRWMLSKDYTINTARAYCTAVLQLFRYYSMGITLRTGSQLSRTTISTGDFNLKPHHVRAMFHSAKDLRSKLLISLGNDLGWGISDVIEIRRDELPDLNRQPPIYWERMRKKTKQVAKTCLSETTVALLKEYVFSFPTNNPYLFHSNGTHISDKTVNQRLRDLASDADIKIGNKNLHWHCFRKMLLSTAKNLGIDPDIIKIMTGKAVKKDILTYMTDINIIDAFKTLQTVTRINGELVKPESDNQLIALGKTVSDMQTRIEELEKEVKDAIVAFETVHEIVIQAFEKKIIDRIEFKDEKGKTTKTILNIKRVDDEETS
jgi:hypothetical protein